MYAQIVPMNHLPAIVPFAHKVMNESLERISLNDEAMALAREIALLPDVEFDTRSNFDNELGNIPERVQCLIEKAFRLNAKDVELTQSRVLYNFRSMCVHHGMKFKNPFSLFLLDTTNYDKLLSGSI